MPQANNNVRRQQWGMCDRDGFFYPMSRLVKQKGLLVCTNSTCYDNLEVERRPFVIEQTMSPGSAEDTEGADRRVIDRGFFSGFDETNQ